MILLMADIALIQHAGPRQPWATRWDFLVANGDVVKTSDKLALGLPLPAMPRDGTSQCLSNCGCAWEIAELDGDGNYDCTWQLGKTENCQTCRQRAADWSPLQIRDGRLT